MLQQQRVLIAVGEANLRQQLHKALLKNDVYSDWAADGREAIDRLSERSYGMIIIDFGLSGDGLESVIAHVAALPVAGRPMVIATGERGLRPMLDSDLVQIILYKPIDVRPLGELIANCLRTLGEHAERARLRAAAPPREERDSRI